MFLVSKINLSTRKFLKFYVRSTHKIYSLLLLIGSAVLFLSISIPDIGERINWIGSVIPLSVMELSHLMGSITALALLFLSRAVYLRIDSSYFITIIFLCLGITTSLLKDFDYETAIILSTLLLAFLPAKKNFYRKSALLQFDINTSWLIQSALIIFASLAVGFFSYKHVEYSNDLLLQFSVEGGASRFLRSFLTIAILLIIFAIYRLLTKPYYALQLPTKEEMDKAESIIRNSDDTMNHLALLGDKYILFSDSGESFIMFSTGQKYWVAMGDPVGRPEESEALVLKFRETADRYNAKTVFYQVGTENLPVYLDVGLSLTKLGEEAHVDLQKFTLDGKQGLRRTYNKLSKELLGFEIIEKERVNEILPEIKKISDDWMKNKKAREKKFSVGFFNEEYLSRCRIAVLKNEKGIVAFANLLELKNKNELSMSLMRYAPDAPGGVMEYLTIVLMLWGKESGYKWFNLGMSPLFGLEKHSLAPLWHKVGNTVFNIGNEFYNFKGLYNYKNKFDPIWKSRYLVTPSGFSIPSALLAVTTIISGGVRGIFSK